MSCMTSPRALSPDYVGVGITTRGESKCLREDSGDWSVTVTGISRMRMSSASSWDMSGKKEPVLHELTLMLIVQWILNFFY